MQIKKGYCCIYFQAHIHDLKKAHANKPKKHGSLFEESAASPFLSNLSTSPWKIFYEYARVFIRTICI